MLFVFLILYSGEEALANFHTVLKLPRSSFYSDAMDSFQNNHPYCKLPREEQEIRYIELFPAQMAVK